MTPLTVTTLGNLTRQSLLNDYNTQINGNFQILKGLTTPQTATLKVGMFYDQNKLNEYNKIIMDNFNLVYNNNPQILDCVLKVGTFNNQALLNDYNQRMLANFELNLPQ